jgi:hypothetical protein
MKVRDAIRASALKTQEVERCAEVERSKLTRRGLGEEQALPLDFATEDRVGVTLGRQL